MSEAEDLTEGTDDIAGRTKRGLLWRFAAKGVAAVIELGVGVVLARLLMPEDFGIMALAYMVIGFVAMFQTIGLPAALVQRELIDDDHTSTAFWTTTAMGLVLAGVMVLLAAPAAAFFREENVRGVMYLLSVTMIFGTVGSVPNALLQRRIDFKKLFWPDIVGGVVYGAVGITMAYLGYSYWSLAGGAIARSFTRMVIVLSLAGFAPRLTWRRQALRDLLGFGVPRSISELLGWMAGNLDYFIIGRALPVSTLGIYKKSYQWSTYVWQNLVSGTSRVLFPALSRVQDEPERLRYAYGRALAGLSLLGWPYAALLAVLAPDLIPSVFGAQWAEAVRPTQILCIAAVLRCFVNPTGAVIHARGFATGAAITQGVNVAALVTGLLVFVEQGIVAVAWVVTAAIALWVVAQAVVLRMCIPWGLADYLRVLWHPLVSTMGGAVVAAAVSNALHLGDAGVAARIVSASVAGYLLFLAIAMAPPRGEGRRIVTEFSRIIGQALSRTYPATPAE